MYSEIHHDISFSQKKTTTEKTSFENHVDVTDSDENCKTSYQRLSLKTKLQIFCSEDDHNQLFPRQPLLKTTKIKAN